MKQIYPDLWQTDLEMRFGVLQSNGYLLKTPEGNGFLYHMEQEHHFPEIEKLGGIQYQYLSHNHEISPTIHHIADHFQAKLCCHQKMEPYFKGQKGADLYFQTNDCETHMNGLQVIYTPGHTDNNLCYAYASPHGKTYLFTGDTLYLDQGIWKTLIVAGDGGNKQDLYQSLLRFKELNIDVIISSLSVGPNQITEVTPNEWQELIDKVIKRDRLDTA